MDRALLLGSVTLAAVFAVAGLAKLADRSGSRLAARAFGAPDRLARVLSVALPIVELSIAVLLLPPGTRQAAAIAALTLLLGFCAAIARVLRHGEAPECHCFGQLHSAPAGPRTLVRNALLAALAAFVALAAGGSRGAEPDVAAWLRGLGGAGWALLGLTAALVAVSLLSASVVVRLLRSYGRVLTRLDAVERRLEAVGLGLDEPEDVPGRGLEPGTAAPVFWLPSTHGERVSLRELLARGKPALLLFTSPTCGPCRMLLPTVARWQRDHADDVTVVLVSGGDPDQVRAEAAEHGLVNVLRDERLDVYGAYEANGTPSAVLVGDDGRIASWLAAGSDWIESLFEDALEGAGRSRGLPVGAEAPAARLELLDGNDATLAELVRGPTLVLFWNPGCGYCRAMHDAVRAFEAAPPEGAPALVVVSAGAVDDVRAEGFAAPVLLDPSWELASACGADGTPMALLLDGESRVASPVVTGAAAALGLLGARELSQVEG